MTGARPAMTPDQYLREILAREQVDNSVRPPVLQVQQIINPIIQTWARTHLVSISPNGSFRKGSANNSGTDIDLFVSLSIAENGAMDKVLS